MAGRLWAPMGMGERPARIRVNAVWRTSLGMTHPLAGHGRLIGCAHDRRAGCWEGLLTRQDGDGARVAVRSGPLAAYSPDAQALVAELAGALEAPILLAADGVGRHGMLIVEPCLAGVLQMFLELCGELHHTL